MVAYMCHVVCSSYFKPYNHLRVNKREGIWFNFSMGDIQRKVLGCMKSDQLEFS